MDDAKATEIRQRMDEVRSSLGDDVEDIVHSARTLTDWRHYVRAFPWACLAGAAALGYLIVPKRVELISPDADALEELAKRNKLVVKSDPKPQAKNGVGAAIASLIVNALARGAVTYVGQNLGSLMGSSAAENNKPTGEASEKPNH